jgi:O-antigen ligase
MFRLDWRGHFTLLPLEVHNKYLLVASELGLVGLALFLWYEGCILQQCFVAMQATRLADRWLGVGLCATVCGSLFFFLFDLFYQDVTLLTLIYMNALAIAAGRLTAREKALES